MKRISSSNRSLKDKALENVSVSRKTSEGVEVLKAGTPLDHSKKHIPYEGSMFGVSKGVTKNMDNYESLRVDVWLNDTVQKGETLPEAVERVDSVLNELLESCVSSVIGDE